MEQSQRLRERFIDAVQDASEFETIAGLYNHIVRQGHRAFTPCPCHNDTTPSLSIDQDAQVGRCWLCLAQGDVFWLVMTHEDLCYRDAVHFWQIAQVLKNRPASRGQRTNYADHARPQSRIHVDWF